MFSWKWILKAILSFFLIGTGYIIAWNKEYRHEKMLPSLLPSDMDKILSHIAPEFTGYNLLFVLHHIGDTEGQHIALRHYPAKEVVQTLKFIDKLLPETSLTALLASSYFAHGGNDTETDLIISYLEHYSAINIDARWSWLLRAAWLACHKMHNFDRARKVLFPLANLSFSHEAPWAREAGKWIKPDHCKKPEFHKTP